MKVDLKDIKTLREKTGVGIMDAKKALENKGGDVKKALRWLENRVKVKAAKKSDRATIEGTIVAYVHQNGKVAAIVKLGCETDFVAKTDDFQNLGQEVAMQVASMGPETVDELIKQTWIRDSNKTIKQLLEEHVAKLGENIKILEFARMKV